MSSFARAFGLVLLLVPAEVRAEPESPLVVAGVEPQWAGRYFRHTEFTAPHIRSYDANGFAVLALSAEVYPLAKSELEMARRFGVTLNYARAFGFESYSSRLGRTMQRKSAPVDTMYSRYDVGARYRTFLARAIELGASIGVAGWDFDFADTLPRAPDLETPSAHYRMMRLGIDGRTFLAPVTLMASFDFLHAFSVEALGGRQIDDLEYPHLPTARAEGAAIRVGAAISVWRALSLKMSAEYAFLVFHLRPLAGRSDEPGRVVDRYFGVGLGPYVSF